MSQTPLGAQAPLTDAEGEQLLRRALWRILPFIFACYVVSYLDRTNVGFAAISMNQDLGLTATMFGWAAGLFFFGYFLFEVPSNLLLQRFGARVWIARIMISWGLISMATAFATGPVSFSILRFLLGSPRPASPRGSTSISPTGFPANGAPRPPRPFCWAFLPPTSSARRCPGCCWTCTTSWG